MLKLQIWVLLIVLLSQPSLSLFLIVKKFGEDVVKVIDDAKEAVRSGTSIISHSERIHMINDFAEMEQNFATYLADILARDIEMMKMEGNNLKDSIVDMTTQFLALIGKIENPEKMDWHDFPIDIALIDIRYSIQDLRNLLGELFKFLKGEIAQHDESCGAFASSIPRLSMDILRLGIVAEIEALGIMKITLLSRDEEEQNEAISQAENDTDHHLNNYKIKVQEIVKLAPRNLRGCDPPNGSWVRDESFFEMERLFQQQLFNYVIGFTYMFKTCNGHAEEFNSGDSSTISFYSRGRTCDGRLLGCNNVGKIKGCLADSPQKTWEWVEDDYSSYGQNIGSCTNRQLSRLQTAWRPTNRHCSCYCTENHNRVSLELMQSNVNDNMVITGLRFMRVENTLYLQPKQGKLLENGRIDPDSQSWLKLPLHGPTQNVTHEHRAFLLDDITVPFGTVVTGVGFFLAEADGKPGFKIKITGVKFDFETGELCDKDECVTSHESWVTERTQIEYLGDNSIYNPNVTHEPDSESNTYIMLARSWLEQDYGQSTVPLFHGVPVETNPPSPLGGIGIFHATGKDDHSHRYAGFIALRLYSLDYQKYLENSQNNFIGKA